MTTSLVTVVTQSITDPENPGTPSGIARFTTSVAERSTRSGASSPPSGNEKKTSSLKS